MDSFDYIKYLKEGRIHEDGSKLITEAEEVSEKKYKQGYDDREDESLGARRGAEKGKKQSFKDRRDESKAMSKKIYGHAYGGDHSMKYEKHYPKSVKGHLGKLISK